jgi:hypothetical protein
MQPIKWITFGLSLLIFQELTAQEFTREVNHFSKVIVSPHINLILQEGEIESVRLVYNDFDPSKINVEVRGKTLRIFLDDARITDKLEKINRRFRKSAYEGIFVTAYVSYKTLEHLEVRGSQEVSCFSPIHAEKKFKLKAYGENEISLAYVRTGYLKTVLYGENKLKIKGGKSDFQKYKLYGENRIDASRMKGYSSSTTSFGDSDVRISSQNEVRINGFGETRVSYSGDPYLSKGLIFGKMDITKRN